MRNIAPEDTSEIEAVEQREWRESLDYVICLSGEVEMQMDNSAVTMKAGDVMVQRGTHHGWSNRTDRTARLAFVLMDAKPVGIGHAVSGSSNAR